ncbi:MAG TPA: ATP-dependent DNA helicase RecG [Pyrinomonadaceae bacterium]|nr:ATP-dependent DNA helicase RecG [Pyrinomonadaceae bacterium]
MQNDLIATAISSFVLSSSSGGLCYDPSQMPAPISLETPVSQLHLYRIARLGPTLSQKLTRALAEDLGMAPSDPPTVEDLLHYQPLRYEDRSKLASIRDLKDGTEASLELYTKVAGGYQVRNKRSAGKSRLFIFEVSATDASRSGRPVVVWWFVSGAHATDILNYYAKRFTRGARFIAFGKWEWDDRRGTFALKLQRPADELEMLPPQSSVEGQSESPAGTSIEPVDENLESDPELTFIHAGRCVPVYRKLGDFPSKRVREVMHGVLSLIPDEQIMETLPQELRQRQRLLGRGKALREIHFPPEDAQLSLYEKGRSAAQLRLIFEDFFWLSFGLQLKRGQHLREQKTARIRIDNQLKEGIAAVLPYKLTGAQRRVVKEIFTDLKSTAAMNRLLQGDVGSGKTIVAVIAMLAAMGNGYQTVLMAPTEILAEQHARNIKRLLAKTPYRVELLSGSLRPAEKRKLRSDLASGEIAACIGTHALIQESVSFANLGLAVIDEQHRFGVLERAELRGRGSNPDVLVMTATPIPRSLAMTVYGDLDVSVIDEMPPGRTPVETRVYGEDQRQEVKRLITREVRAGRQVYVVYPLVEESEKMDLRDATRRYEYLRDKVFPRFSVGLVHGRMKAIDKEAVMREFLSGKIQVLVSTTVIEVGVDVPNASLMIVEHAERFGLSQLHQLRGRVGRGAEKSYCILLTSDRKTSVAEVRLGIMAKTNDGFLIAEKDLELRGAGELLGTRQSGLPEFRFANLIRDQQILEKARQEAEFYLTRRAGSITTANMIKRVRRDARLRLAAVG